MAQDSTVTYVPNPDLVRDLARDLGLKAALREAAEQIGHAAEQEAAAYSSSYRTRVEDLDRGDTTHARTVPGARVIAATQTLDHAGWLEFGTRNYPPRAPLRRAVEATGLELGD